MKGSKMAILRFSNLPISLPRALVNAVLDLPYEEQHTLIKRTVKNCWFAFSTDPFCASVATYWWWEVFILAVGKEKLSEISLVMKERRNFQLLYLFLSGFNEDLNYWYEFRQQPSHIRLFMIWAHANELYRLFSSLGVSRFRVRRNVFRA